MRRQEVVAATIIFAQVCTSSAWAQERPIRESAVRVARISALEQQQQTRTERNGSAIFAGAFFVVAGAWLLADASDTIQEENPGCSYDCPEISDRTFYGSMAFITAGGLLLWHGIEGRQVPVAPDKTVSVAPTRGGARLGVQVGF